MHGKVMDHGNTEAGHVVVSHDLLDREWISALAIGQLRTFNFCDHLGTVSERASADGAYAAERVADAACIAIESATAFLYAASAMLLIRRMARCT